jgi:hypothetical protein
MIDLVEMISKRRRALAAIPIAAAIVAGCGAADASNTKPAAPTTASSTATGKAHQPSKSGEGTGGSTTTLSVGRPIAAPPIAPGFVGISTIYQAFEQEAGTASSLDPVLVQLLKNLAPGQRPVIRLGGDSADWTWWPVPHMAMPLGIRFTLDNGWIAAAKALAQAADARLILSVNLEANSRKVAAVEANALVHGIGSSSVAALELGNEPELYSVFGWYHTKSGAKVLGRPLGWNPATYFHDYASVSGGLPHLPLAGPDVGGPNWIAALGQFLHNEPRVRLATVHAYPLKVCAATTHVTIPELLSTQSSAGLAAQLQPAVRTAHSHHVPLRLDETNAVSCGGEPGVSNTFATALWSVDFFYQLAKIGISGVNVNSVNTPNYSPFSFTSAGGQWSAQVHPIYYGMQLFADAAPAGSHLLSVNGRTSSTLRAWATRGSDGTLRVMLVNDALSTPADVALRLPASTPASVSLLRAPHVDSTSGVTLGGQSYGASTTTGTLAGTAANRQLTPAHGKYSLRVPPATAALLTVPAH